MTKQDNQQQPPLLDVKALAAAYRLTVGAVRKWRAKGLEPAARGARGKMLFDKTQVDAWLAERGIEPGSQGSGPYQALKRRQAAEKKRGAQKRGPAPAPKKNLPKGQYGLISTMKAAGGSGEGATEGAPDADPSPAGEGAGSKGGPPGCDPAETTSRHSPTTDPEELGLDAALAGIERIEMRIRQRIEDALADPMVGVDEKLGLISNLKNYKEVFDQLRKATETDRKEQQARGVLVSSADLKDTVGAMCSMIRTAADGFSDTAAPDVISAMRSAGVEIDDMALFERTLRDACRKASDDWLAQLSEKLRSEGT